MLRIAVSALLLAGLSACVTTTPAHNLSDDAVRALRLERVDVVLDPSATIIWPTLTHELTQMSSAGGAATVSDPQAAAPVLRAEALARLRTEARKTVEPPLRTRLAGTKLVVARVTIHRLFIPNAAGVIVSGLLAGTTAPGAQSGMVASVDFVDARTGAVLLSYPRTHVSTQGGYKINMGTSGIISHDPVERLFADLGSQAASWLVKA